MTVVTQFLTHDGTDVGNRSEVQRFYMQDGKVIENSEATVLGPSAGSSITDEFCSKQKAKGALKQMGEALDRGMVLVLSLWDDTDVSMLWLDSAYPTNELAAQRANPSTCAARSRSRTSLSRTSRLGRSDLPCRTAAVVAWTASNTSEVHRHGKLAIS